MEKLLFYKDYIQIYTIGHNSLRLRDLFKSHGGRQFTDENVQDGTSSICIWEQTFFMPKCSVKSVVGKSPM